jgi:hypothetical protein
MFLFRSHEAMDNRLNEVRRKISKLRAEMLALENQIALQITHDMECSEVSLRLMEMRQDLVALIQQRDALGGAEMCASTNERLLMVGRTGPGVLGKRATRP